MVLPSLPVFFCFLHSFFSYSFIIAVFSILIQKRLDVESMDMGTFLDVFCRFSDRVAIFNDLLSLLDVMDSDFVSPRDVRIDGECLTAYCQHISFHQRVDSYSYVVAFIDLYQFCHIHLKGSQWPLSCHQSRSSQDILRFSLRGHLRE